MKIKLLILLIFSSLVVRATNFYIGAGGNNNNNGTSINTRWLDVTKVNSSTFAPGDSILFAGCETHKGGLKVSSNGVIIGSYGGGQAIISGFKLLTGWVLIAPNIWECPTTGIKATCNILTIDGTPYAAGRYPNSTYLPYQTANTTTLTSTSLTGSYSNMAGAEAVIRKNNYSAEKVSITSQSGNIITYTTNKAIDNNSPTAVNGTANYGFFLQRFAASLDQFGEWYFNPATNKMRLYTSANPANYDIKASYIDTVIYTGTHTNVTVYNVFIEGGGLYGLYALNGANMTVKNNNFNWNTRSIYSKNGVNINISNNALNNSFETGIMVGLVGKQINILNNTIINTGQLIGMGLFWSPYDLNGISAITDATTTSNFINIYENYVYNTAHMGIDARGSNFTVRRNIVDRYANQVDDAGGIYTWVARTTVNSTNYTGRTIDSNFVSNGIGAFLGTDGTAVRVKGIYLDDQSLNILCAHNTIYNVPGNAVSMNNPKNILFIDNTVYNCNVGISLVQKINGTISGNFIKKNIVYQKLNGGQENWFHQNDNLQSTGKSDIIQSGRDMAYIDSNWVTNLLTNGYRTWYSATGSGMTFPPAFPVATWRSSYLKDIATILPPVPITNTNTNIYTNSTSNSKTINFPGYRKRDPKGVIYDHLATIPAWSSIILIDNGLAPSAGNIHPVANAGADIVITLPTNNTSLSGSGSTDADGTIAAYLWSKISGPASGTITTQTNVNTTLTGLTQGTYNFKLRVTDNVGDTSIDFVQVQVNPANIAPVANAGSDITITVPANSTTLVGSGTDQDGTITAYLWTKVSGPAGGNITSSTSSSTGIASLQAGTYVYSLRVTDNQGLTGTDLVQVIVNPANIAPTANAGSDKPITLPTNSVVVTGSGTDPDGVIIDYGWVKISGPAGGTIIQPNNALTPITDLQEGTYVYRLTVTDDDGAFGTDFMQIIVLPEITPVNQPPIAVAGIDQTITLPTNSTNLIGATSSDPDGTISAYLWTKISGPSGGNITSSTFANTGVTGLIEGVYIYQLRVTDNLGDTATDAVQVRVFPGNIAPSSNAGTDQVLTLPTNSTTLLGSGTDPDGTISSYLWRKISGPAGGNISSSTIATTGITVLQQGVYIYQLRVIDNSGDSSTDAVQITVNAANIAPIANAGLDISITLPINTTTLSGSGTDVDGTITAYLWRKISGPAGGTITANTNPTTGITVLVAGQYIYSLRVTDNSGDTATDAVQITVNPAPPQLPPVADAGIGQTIILPVDSTILNGSATDQDGIIVSYAWAQVTGPNSATITPNNTPSTSITGLIEGTYEFELTATDNDGLIGKDTVQVIVNPTPPNIPPVAQAGGDILTFTTSVTLNGAGSDQGGTIVSYHWVKILGAVGDVITNPNSATTTVTGLTIGVYEYELTVIDGDGATATDRAIVTVKDASSTAVILRLWQLFP